MYTAIKRDIIWLCYLFPCYYISFLFQALTAQIGNVLELKDVEKGIDDYLSTPHLTFDQYRYYLFKEVETYINKMYQ